MMRACEQRSIAPRFESFVRQASKPTKSLRNGKQAIDEASNLLLDEYKILCRIHSNKQRIVKGVPVPIHFLETGKEK
jgi:hypothetical protein